MQCALYKNGNVYICLYCTQRDYRIIQMPKAEQSDAFMSYNKASNYKAVGIQLFHILVFFYNFNNLIGQFIFYEK